MTDLEMIKHCFDAVGIGYAVEGNKLILDEFEVDGATSEIVIKFYDDDKYQEFVVYSR